ncbi:hypothetical protein CK203_004871 [Vitis vinifera]|uniref:DUF4283 domain-containing protein n=1 Tax=Vitis vinifera TaxID=29760 RepID=A0A438KGK3_VITVI|nr:hypothetical protein CK203_004871 [Vitis vinifera]
MGCRVGKISTSYLGLSLGASFKSMMVWNVEKERLWKRETESLEWSNGLNKARRFILLLCRDIEAKRYSIIFPEGKGQASGWNSLAVRLRGLGVTPSKGLKFTNVPEAPLKPKGVLEVQWKEKGVETKSFAEAVKSTSRRAGESVWLEVGEKEVCGRLEQLKHCLMGSGVLSQLHYLVGLLRNWTRQNWEVKGKLSISVLGRGIMMFDSSWLKRLACFGQREKKH